MAATTPRVLFVTTSFPLHQDHWSGVFIAVQARALARMDCQVTVLAPSGEKAKSHEQLGDLTVHRFRYLPRWVQRLAYGGGIPANLQATPWLWGTVPPFAASMALAVTRHAAKADIIHAHWSFAGMICSFLPAVRRRPLIVSYHGSDLAGRGPFLSAAKRVNDHAAAVVVHSHEMLRRALKAGAPPDRILHIPHGIETNSFLPHEGGGDVLRLLAIGRLSREKGFDLLLEAVADLPTQPPWTLEIIGEGPQREHLQKQITDLELKSVSLPGPLSPAQVREKMALSDILIVPSRREGFGVTALEGLAAGLPVIGASVGALPEIVKEGECGLLVPAGDSIALKTALSTLLADPDWRRQMGETGRQRVLEHFAAEKTNAPLLALYRRLMTGA